MQSGYQIETKAFLKNPFNLLIGDNINIRMRAKNFGGVASLKLMRHPQKRVTSYENMSPRLTNIILR
jgi:hypothetical protein